VAKKKTDTRKISCDFCGKEHFIQHGGWVVSGNKKMYCHSIEKSCLVKKKNEEGYHGTSRTISDYWNEL
jgi:hypothetical protein